MAVASGTSANNNNSNMVVVDMTDDDDSIDADQLEEYREELEALGSFPVRFACSFLVLLLLSRSARAVLHHW